jgi:hypothetical protein
MRPPPMRVQMHGCMQVPAVTPADKPIMPRTVWIARGMLFMLGLLGGLAFVGYTKAQRSAMVTNVMVLPEASASQVLLHAVSSMLLRAGWAGTAAVADRMRMLDRIPAAPCTWWPWWSWWPWWPLWPCPHRG